jgi:hypothetical protein
LVNYFLSRTTARSPISGYSGRIFMTNFQLEFPREETKQVVKEAFE